mmetsp:Transcript_45278/g.120085  ORF Transcript_45278/g.120085 Transcript_45278/m.120085 type:complete len:243 (-) Transcript_45278:1783-2511(-)
MRFVQSCLHNPVCCSQRRLSQFYPCSRQSTVSDKGTLLIFAQLYKNLSWRILVGDVEGNQGDDALNLTVAVQHYRSFSLRYFFFQCKGADLLIPLSAQSVSHKIQLHLFPGVWKLRQGVQMRLHPPLSLQSVPCNHHLQTVVHGRNDLSEVCERHLEVRWVLACGWCCCHNSAEEVCTVPNSDFTDELMFLHRQEDALRSDLEYLAHPLGLGGTHTNPTRPQCCLAQPSMFLHEHLTLVLHR